LYKAIQGLNGPLTDEGYTVVMSIRNGEDSLWEEWEIPITVDEKKIAQTKQTDINDEYEIEGQKIMIKSVKTSPTRVGITFEFPEKNSMRIFDIEDLRLVNEKGETCSRIASGVVASGDFKEKTYYLQSNYFKRPKELYLVFNTLRALDKDNLLVKVDTENLDILQSPDGKLAKVEYEENVDNAGVLFFSWDKAYEQVNHLNPIQSYKNGNGEDRKLSTQYQEEAGSVGLSRFGFPYERTGHPGEIITFELQDYPSWIHGEVKIP
jgi:hypothetical protein